MTAATEIDRGSVRHPHTANEHTVGAEDQGLQDALRVGMRRGPYGRVDRRRPAGADETEGDAARHRPVPAEMVDWMTPQWDLDGVEIRLGEVTEREERGSRHIVAVEVAYQKI